MHMDNNKNLHEAINDVINKVELEEVSFDSGLFKGALKRGQGKINDGIDVLKGEVRWLKLNGSKQSQKQLDDVIKKFEKLAIEINKIQP